MIIYTIFGGVYVEFGRSKAISLNNLIDTLTFVLSTPFLSRRELTLATPGTTKLSFSKPCALLRGKIQGHAREMCLSTVSVSSGSSPSYGARLELSSTAFGVAIGPISSYGRSVHIDARLSPSRSNQSVAIARV